MNVDDKQNWRMSERETFSRMRPFVAEEFKLQNSPGRQSVSDEAMQEFRRGLRKGLNAVFSFEEYRLMLDCAQGDFYPPKKIHKLATDLCAEHGIEVDEYQKTPLASIVGKLLSLNSSQKVALADVLSLLWCEHHNGVATETALFIIGVETCHEPTA